MGKSVSKINGSACGIMVVRGVVRQQRPCTADSAEIDLGEGASARVHCLRSCSVETQCAAGIVECTAGFGPTTSNPEPESRRRGQRAGGDKHAPVGVNRTTGCGKRAAFNN